MTKLQFTHKKLTEVTDKAQKNKLLAEWCSRRKKTLETTVYTDNDKKNCLSPKKFYPPHKNNGPDSLSPDNYYSI